MAEEHSDWKRSVLKAVRSVELGSHSAYKASFAGGNSGLSFGSYQNDVAQNRNARDALRDILAKAQGPDGSPLLNGDEFNRAMNLASRPGITAQDFEREAPGLLRKTDQALGGDYGRATTDKTDAAQETEVSGYIDQVQAAARRNPHGMGVFDPDHPRSVQAAAMAAQWGNRTGGVKDVCTWAEGGDVVRGKDTAHPVTVNANGAPGMDTLIDYFGKTKEFRGQNQKLDNWVKQHDAGAGYDRPLNPGDFRMPGGQPGWSPERGRTPGQTDGAGVPSPSRDATFLSPDSSMNKNSIEPFQNMSASRQASQRPGQEATPVRTFVERRPRPGEEPAEHPGAAFIREEREMLRKPPQIERFGAEVGSDRFRSAQGQTPERKRELPRPVNMLTDLLPPELDPDGSINADLLQRRAENPAIWGGTADDRGGGLYVPPPKSQRPPGFVAIHPELDEEETFVQPARRARPGGYGSKSLGGIGTPATNSEEMSTLDFVKESFRLAAQESDTPRPKRPAWFKPTNPEELTTEEYIWEIFHPEAAKKYRR